MSWPKVAVIFIFVAGAVTAAAMGQKDLGLCLAAAAAGFVHLGGQLGRGRKLRKSLPPKPSEH